MGAQADERLRERITTWKRAFLDDTTGIHKTINDLLWSYAAYSTTAHIVRLHAAGVRNDIAINRMVFDLVRAGFWSNLLLGVRRLLDKAPIKGRDGVYSLRSVLTEIRACRTVLIRERYVTDLRLCAYDLEELRAAQDRELRAAAGKAIWGNGELARSEFAHRDFDFLSGVNPVDRAPADLISLTVLQKLEDRLSHLDGICGHVSTHLAHAGNEQSREGKQLLGFGIGEARGGLKELKEVADLVGAWFANEGGSGLSTPQYNQFEGLDLPLVATADIDELERNWLAVEDDIQAWAIDLKNL